MTSERPTKRLGKKWVQVSGRVWLGDAWGLVYMNECSQESVVLHPNEVKDRAPDDD